MTDRERNEQRDWAGQVPRIRYGRPYRDYGWERHQSALPEFRDPDVHIMPDERDRVRPWQKFHERSVVDPEDFPAMGSWQEWYLPGPHTGKGPRGYKCSDERIFNEICEEITRHGDLDASDIEVQVKDQEVTLTGTVRDRRAKRLAEDISDSIPGVQDVHNRLQLQSGRGTPERWTDEVGQSGVYPASEAQNAPKDAEAQGMASWGQGERGAEGYYDHGESELTSAKATTTRSNTP